MVDLISEGEERDYNDEEESRDGDGWIPEELLPTGVMLSREDIAAALEPEGLKPEDCNNNMFDLPSGKCTPSRHRLKALLELRNGPSLEGITRTESLFTRYDGLKKLLLKVQERRVLDKSQRFGCVLSTSDLHAGTNPKVKYHCPDCGEKEPVAMVLTKWMLALGLKKVRRHLICIVRADLLYIGGLMDAGAYERMEEG